MYRFNDGDYLYCVFVCCAAMWRNSGSGGCVRIDPRLESQKVKNEIIADRKRKFAAADCDKAVSTMDLKITRLAELLKTKKLLESANCERKVSLTL